MRIIYIMEALKEAYQMKDTADKQQLNLTVNTDVVKRARDLKINISEITEKVLRAFTASSKTADEEKTYQGYQDLFNLMMPLLQKFKVSTRIASEIVSWETPSVVGIDEDGNETYDSPDPAEWFDTYLQPDGSLEHDYNGSIKIRDIIIDAFLRPEQIIDEFLESIQKGAEYRKKQFKEIEMAKTIIDAITKGVIPKTKSKGKGR